MGEKFTIAFLLNIARTNVIIDQEDFENL